MNSIMLFVIAFFSFSLSAQNDNCNCCTPQHEAFDFWIGEWEVTNPQGVKVGDNKIVKQQDNCLLIENWVGANGRSTGTSQNFYNPKTKQWEQLWVDNQGGHLKLKGGRKGNQMVLLTDEATNKDGKPFYHRVTWTANDDGTVRQLWETIVNNTETTIVFDGLYKKKTD